jgi:hypothetical protein
MAEYKGTVELISGITPKNNGDFPLVNAKDVQMPDGSRLSDLESKVCFKTDETLTLSGDNVLSVNTAKEPDPDNTLPITSAAVAASVGNIEIILKTI